MEAGDAAFGERANAACGSVVAGKHAARRRRAALIRNSPRRDTRRRWLVGVERPAGRGSVPRPDVRSRRHHERDEANTVGNESHGPPGRAPVGDREALSSYRTIWDDAQNAELKRARVNPNVIFPGDRLFIPAVDGKCGPATPAKLKQVHGC